MKKEKINIEKMKEELKEIVKTESTDFDAKAKEIG